MTMAWATRVLKRFIRLFVKPAGGLDCQQVMERLYEYIDGELEDPRQVKVIREHLRVCQRCFPRYEFEKAFLRFLTERGGNEAPPGFRRRIFQRLLEQGSRS